MSREDGFSVMDVSTSIHEDPKFKRLARRHPELAAPAFLAYVALMGESWRGGERLPIEDAWPSLIPFDRAVVAALRRFDLIDGDGMVAPETWAHWFGPAQRRQEQSRERWRRANDRRHAAAMAALASDSADTARLPRGDTRGTAATDPSDRPTDPSVLRGLTSPSTSGGARPISLVDPEGRTA